MFLTKENNSCWADLCGLYILNEGNEQDMLSVQPPLENKNTDNNTKRVLILPLVTY